MNIENALEIVVGRTGQESYRDLCNPSHPRFNPDYIPVVMRMAENVPMPVAIMGEGGAVHAASEYPSLARQAYNATLAAGRAAGALATGQAVVVPPEVAAERLAICKSCDRYDADKQRCKACGCYNMKMNLAQEQCPLNPPKWLRYTDMSKQT